MAYTMSTQVSLPFDRAVERVKEELSKEGFGVLTEIDVKTTLKNKLDVDFRNYRILGACNPPFAHKALQAELHIGVMLPCNVIVYDVGEGRCEVAAVDPLSSMQAVDNDSLREIAEEVREKLQKVVKNLAR